MQTSEPNFQSCVPQTQGDIPCALSVVCDPPNGLLQPQSLICASQTEAPLPNEINPKPAVTINDIFDNYYLPFIRNKKRSWHDDELRYNTHIRASLGGLRPDQLTPARIQQAFDTLASAKGGKKVLKEATKNRVKAMFKTFCKRLEIWGYLDSNPTRHLQLNRERNQRTRILEDRELEKFFSVLAEAPLQFRLLILFLLYTTVRLNEALTCLWAAVSVEQRILWLQDTKSGKPRAVPLSAGALEVIAELARIRTNDHLFPSKSGGHMARPTRLFNKFKAMTGMHDLWLHDLRRTGASFACRNGASMHDVSKLLGHSNVLVTERYVVAHNPRIQAAAEGIGDLIKSIVSKDVGD